ncbi:hypothetical protein GW17_00061683, partial [Ensete ventricosum]
EVEFRSIFRAPSRKFKILAIPNVLAHGKSYKYGFVKKCDGHKLCAKSRAKSSFDRFFVHRLRNFVKIRDGHKLYKKSHAKSSFDQFFMLHLENSKY